ncbi:MAG: hypothetical protein ABFD57_06745 [Smithella sp.]
MNNSKRMLQLLSCFLILFFVFGCTDERKTKLEKGVGFVRSLTNTNPVQSLAAANYQADTPEGMVMLYHSSLPADGSYPNVYSDRKSLQPWSLLILPGNKERSLIIEGYGDDLTKPLIVEEIIFK